jgi:hypothetical protein
MARNVGLEMGVRCELMDGSVAMDESVTAGLVIL